MRLSFESQLVLFFLILTTGIIALCIIVYYDNRQDDRYAGSIAAGYQKLITLEHRYLATRDSAILTVIREELARDRFLLSEEEKERAETQRSFYNTYFGLTLTAAAFIVIFFFIIRNQFLFRKRAEQNLRILRDELQHRHHLVMDNMQEGIQIIGHDWRYQYLNKAVREQSRHGAVELTGRSMLDVYPQIKGTALYTTIKKVMETRVAERMENQFDYGEGKTGYFDLSIEPVPEGILIFSTDISLRKSRELEREAHLAQLKEILFKLSHEVRHPVARILAVAQHLEEFGPIAGEQGQMMQAIKQSANELDGYVRELSDFVSDQRKES